jgi:glycosyltransferase involved in cell wall biosynthesis
LPSGYGETWGLVVNEALASGLPCLASDACGCSEDLVAAVDPRFVFRCGDTAGIVDALYIVRQQSPSYERQSEVIATHEFRVTTATVTKLFHAEQ